jgi:hypothetical protein
VKQDTKKVNKTMFWIGVTTIVIVAVLLLTVKVDLRVWPMFIGIMGIVFIGDSKYRPLKK